MVTQIYDYVMMGLGSNGCFVTITLCLNEGHIYGFASSVGPPRSDSIRLLVYEGMRTIFGVLVLYYRPLETVLTLPIKG
jgi:hypothetical protein